MSDQIPTHDQSPVSTLIVRDEELGPLLSCLLNAKFNGDLRMEFVTSPILNDVISQVIAKGRQRGLPSPWFSGEDNFVIQKVELGNPLSIFGKIYKVVLRDSVEGDRDARLSEAFFPYRVE